MSLRSSCRPLAQLLIALSLCIVSGGHWFALQTLAWAGMLATYSQQANISTAVRMTFDGQHPCAMCKKIQKARQSEKNQKELSSVQKLEFLLTANPTFPGRLHTVEDWVLLSATASAVHEPPRLPPPRRFPSA